MRANIWCQCIVATQSASQQLQYLLQVCNGLLQILSLLVFLLPDHVLLLLVQESDDVGNFGVLVHVEGQVVQGRDRLTFTGCKTGHKNNILNIETFLSFSQV